MSMEAMHEHRIASTLELVWCVGYRDNRTLRRTAWHALSLLSAWCPTAVRKCVWGGGCLHTVAKECMRYLPVMSL